MAPSRDPEVVALTSQIRFLTRQARLLSQDIDRTLEELDEYTDDVYRERDRRKQSGSWSGTERRRG